MNVNFNPRIKFKHKLNEWLQIPTLSSRIKMKNSEKNIKKKKKLNVEDRINNHEGELKNLKILNSWHKKLVKRYLNTSLSLDFPTLPFLKWFMNSLAIAFWTPLNLNLDFHNFLPFFKVTSGHFLNLISE